MSTGVSHSLYGVWAAGPDAIWAVGGLGDPATPNGVLLFHDGGAGGFTIVDDTVAGTLRAVHGTGPDDIWAVGKNVRLHNDGSGFVADATAPDFDVASVWAHAPDLAWVVGENGRTQRFDGTGWSDVPTGLGLIGLSAVGGTGPDDVLALGSNGAMLSFENGAWRSVGSYENVTLFSLWVYSVKAAFAVGTEGGLTRFTLDGFFDVDSGTDAFLFGVHGTSPDDVWVAGWEGTILHVVPGDRP